LKGLCYINNNKQDNVMVVCPHVNNDTYLVFASIKSFKPGINYKIKYLLYA